jgi:parallel beta-helix repeat protein
MLTRRRTLELLTATLSLAAVPARARAGSRFDRETVSFAPLPEEASIDTRLNALIVRLSEAGGGTIRLAPGVHPTTGQIRVLDGIRIVGTGMRGPRASVIRLADGAPPFADKAGILRLKRDWTGLDRRIVKDIVLEDFAIDGNRDRQRQGVADAEKKYGLYAEAHDVIVRRITILNCMGYGFDPHGTVDGRPSERLLIEECVAIGNAKDGFTLDHQLGTVMRRCVAQRNGRAGINIVTSTKDTIVEDNVCLENGGNGIVVQNDSRALLLRANQVFQNGHQGIYLRAAGDLRVEDNRIWHNARAGVRIAGGERITLRGNTIWHNLRDGKTRQSEVELESYLDEGPRNVSVDANRIAAKRRAAVMDAHGSAATRITGNVYQARGRGIVLRSPTTVAEGNTQLRLRHWHTPRDPLA